MYKAAKKTKAIWRYMEALALHTGAQTVHWEENTNFISVLESKIVTTRVKILKFLYDFYKNNLKMVFLFQNIRSLVSWRQICAPKHVQVQLPVVVLNGWQDSDYVQPVIKNTINSWCYMNLLWTKRIMKRSKISLMQQNFHQRYYVNFLISEFPYCNRQNHARNWWNENFIKSFFLIFK